MACHGAYRSGRKILRTPHKNRHVSKLRELDDTSARDDLQDELFSDAGRTIDEAKRRFAMELKPGGVGR